MREPPWVCQPDSCQAKASRRGAGTPVASDARTNAGSRATRSGWARSLAGALADSRGAGLRRRLEVGAARVRDRALEAVTRRLAAAGGLGEAARGLALLGPAGGARGPGGGVGAPGARRPGA